MKTGQCFFLCFRVDRVGGCINWDEPCGGLVMKAETTIVENEDGEEREIPVADFGLARDILEQRFHCTPLETLLVAEVYQPEEQWTARLLHRDYELGMESFLELMEVE